MIARFAPLLLCLTLAGSLLAGCGTAPGGSAGVQAQATSGKNLVKLGFGAEGGASPSLIRRANGEWVLVYVGTNVSDRRLYWTTSTDGARWAAPRLVEDADYSDQAPALIEDAQGALHVFFTSNRNGEHFELRHARLDGAVWTDSEEISGYTGVQDVSAAFAGGRFLLATEIQAEGLFVSASADGIAFTEREQVALAGFEPSVTFLPSGRAMVAYTRGNELLTRSSALGADWDAEQVVMKTPTRLRGPALLWSGDHGKLVFAERVGTTGTNYQLREKRFTENQIFSDGKPLVAFGGEANSPALATDHNGKIGLAWGMKLSSSQLGIAFTFDGWK